MKVSQKTSLLLKPFKQIADSVVITPSSAFYVFGKGKTNQFNSLVVEGFIQDNHSDYGHYSLSEIESRILTPVPVTNVSSDPQKKMHYFDQLFANANVSASFVLDDVNLKKLCSAKKGTHIRFWSKKQGDVFARAFDARKYYEKIMAVDREKHELCTLRNHLGDVFTVYSELDVLKRLKKDSYEVTIYDIGILSFAGLEQNMTYYIRDQKLGSDWSDYIETSALKDIALLFHPKRVKAVRNRMKIQN